MSQTIKDQLNHRTIRFFKDEPIAQDILDQLWQVMNQTASSNGLQSCSIIRVTDKEIKQKLAQICNQNYVANLPELYIFIVDSHRIEKIALEKGYTGDSYRGMDQFFKGFTDACLMAQNLNNAIESIGLGAVYLGSILNDINEVIQLLHLPPLTFPVLGIGFGYPNDDPQLKPRMPIAFKMHENAYETVDSYVEMLQAYDQEMMQYYDTRLTNKRSDSYTQQVLNMMEADFTDRKQIVQYIQNQGFDLKLKES